MEECWKLELRLNLFDKILLEKTMFAVLTGKLPSNLNIQLEQHHSLTVSLNWVLQLVLTWHELWSMTQIWTYITQLAKECFSFANEYCNLAVFECQGLYYYQKAKQAMHLIGFNRIKANCHAYSILNTWRNEGLVILVMWVDDKMVISLPSVEDKEKHMMKNLFECNDLGSMT